MIGFLWLCFKALVLLGGITQSETVSSRVNIKQYEGIPKERLQENLYYVFVFVFVLRH